MTIRVVVADDQPLLRTGFKALIAAAPDLEVVGEAGDGREAVRLARAAQADVVLMDIRMPVLDGIAATRLISADDDLAGVRVLILTTFEIDEYVFAALRAGASGFLGKSAEADELLSAIRTVSRGDALLSPAATRSLIGRFLATPAAPPADDAARRGLAALTDREREITVMVAAGLSNDEIAARLVLSPATVKTHVNRAMAKVGARDRAQLVVFAHRCGLLLPAGEAGRGWLAPLSQRPGGRRPLLPRFRLGLHGLDDREGLVNVAADAGHRVEGVPDRPGAVDHVGDPSRQHAEYRRDTVALTDLAASVAEQREREVVVSGEPGVLVHGVGADPDHLGAGRGEHLVAVAEGARLGGAAAGLVPGVEVENHHVLGEAVAEAYLLTGL